MIKEKKMGIRKKIIGNNGSHSNNLFQITQGIRNANADQKYNTKLVVINNGKRRWPNE